MVYWGSRKPQISVKYGFQKNIFGICGDMGIFKTPKFWPNRELGEFPISFMFFMPDIKPDQYILVVLDFHRKKDELFPSNICEMNHSTNFL